MYNIKNLTDGTETISDTCVLVALHPNGSYVQASDRYPAQGFCAKIPTTYDELDENSAPTGNTVETLADTVFAFAGKTMRGAEPTGEYEEAPAVPVIRDLEDDLEQAYELLYGGEA